MHPCVRKLFFKMAEPEVVIRHASTQTGHSFLATRRSADAVASGPFEDAREGVVVKLETVDEDVKPPPPVLKIKLEIPETDGRRPGAYSPLRVLPPLGHGGGHPLHPKLTTLPDQKAALQARLLTTTRYVTSLKSQLYRANYKCKFLQADNSILRRHCQVLQSGSPDSAALHGQLSEIRVDLQTQKRHLQLSQEKLSASMNNVTQLERAILILQNECDRLREQIERISYPQHSINTHVAEVTNDLVEKNAELFRVKQLLAHANAFVQELQQTIVNSASK